MTEEQLEQAYNPRVGVDNPLGIFETWVTRSTRALEGQDTRRNLAYGEGRRERLDVFQARGTGPSPLLVFIHGGYWRSHIKENYYWIAPPFVERGITVAFIEYEIAPVVRVATIVAQVRSAVAWLYRHARDFNVDPGRIVITGHSAGAHLAAMVACTKWKSLGDDLPATLADSILTISALTDLGPLQRISQVNAELRLDDGEVATLSPARLQPNPGVKIVTAVGSLESEEFRRQTAVLSSNWRNNEVHHVPLPGLNHYTACEELAVESSPLFSAALKLSTGAKVDQP